MTTTAPDTFTVTLTPSEMHSAATVGLARWLTSRVRNYRPTAPHDSTWRNIGADISGAVGELGFCRVFGLFWPARVGTPDLPDVDPNIEVRYTELPSGKLKIKQSDPDDWWAYLITGPMPTLTVRGGIKIGTAKRHPEWIADPGGLGAPAWWVPPEALHRPTAALVA